MSWLETYARCVLASFLIAGGVTLVRAGEAPAPSFGRPLAPDELKTEVAFPPSGAGLPPGRGDAEHGKEVYAAACVACHGDKLQGVKATGGTPLIGGRGTLTSVKPVKTVESYWPYATTLFDYVKRAMPFNAPGSLSDEQTYAVVAYILAEGHVIQPTDTLDAATLPKVRMPNAAGFVPDPRRQ